MATTIQWKHGRTPRPRGRQEPRPLQLFKSALGEMARVALAEPFMIAIERQEIYLRRLPQALDGFRIVHLSDLHYGPMVEPRHLDRAISIANDLNPDLIALTGDYISQERTYAAPCAEGVSMLINEGTRIDARGESFSLAGVDDTMVGLEDLPLALAGSRDDEFRLLLAHNPIILRRAARAQVDLVLSGHTHGGQVTLRPEKNLSGKPRRRMLRGLGRRANTQ